MTDSKTIECLGSQFCGNKNLKRDKYECTLCYECRTILGFSAEFFPHELNEEDLATLDSHYNTKKETVEQPTEIRTCEVCPATYETRIDSRRRFCTNCGYTHRVNANKRRFKNAPKRRGGVPEGSIRIPGKVMPRFVHIPGEGAETSIAEALKLRDYITKKTYGNRNRTITTG